MIIWDQLNRLRGHVDPGTILRLHRAGTADLELLALVAGLTARPGEPDPSVM